MRADEFGHSLSGPSTLPDLDSIMTLKQALAAPNGTTFTHPCRDNHFFTRLCAAGYFPVRIFANREFTFQRMSGGR